MRMLLVSRPARAGLVRRLIVRVIARDDGRLARNTEEDVISVDPFEARFTFTIDGDAITLTVDEDLTVTAVHRTGN
jgi:hypothetical protein